MDIRFIDELAANGRTPLHAALPWAKVLASALLLTSTIASSSPAMAGLVAGAVVLLACATKQPLWYTARIAIYPVVFAALFAIGSVWSNPLYAITIVTKAFTAGLIAATLITTTSFVDVFSIISHVLPSLVADALFMGYRAFFILVDELQGLMVAVRLRGGVSGTLPQQLRTYGQMLGVLVIHSADMTERMYRVMQVRGYSQRISATSEHRPPNAMDFALLAYSALTLVGVFLYR
ncbi:MAG TPA: energy-coupling factor transporter transmembrane component T [Bacillota bacterium]|nr:energy-coupling factor transporter transmembrane component T [Bacillota bacterium]HOL51280.1 energy-coupling factor transporter transmembrane component T [Bacillota bacterium]HOO30416.1 energy-coupling factor transporter transmembrane component T [Bacillota bacterium]